MSVIRDTPNVPDFPAPPPPSEKILTALYPYSSSTPGVFSFKKEEEFIFIDEKSNGWILVRRVDGSEEGFVPKSYLADLSSLPPIASLPQFSESTSGTASASQVQVQEVQRERGQNAGDGSSTK